MSFIPMNTCVSTRLFSFEFENYEAADRENPGLNMTRAVDVSVIVLEY